MSKVLVLNIKGIEIVIQCDIKEKINDIYQRFLSSIPKDLYKINFIYNEKKVKNDLSLEEIANEKDRKRNIMNIFVLEFNSIIKNKNIKKSKYIICPECSENIKINIDDYNMHLFDCKNRHIKNNILISEYDCLQNFDISKINCNICQQKFNNNFYSCFTCGTNICFKCKKSHDKNHKIINYENKNIFCEKHFEPYIKYCNLCKKNICNLCNDNHKNHDILLFDDLLIKKEDLIKEMSEFKNYKNKFFSNINIIMNKLINTIDIIETYYNTCNNIINSYDFKNKNYYILQNMNEFINYNHIIMNDMKFILDEKDIFCKFKKIIELNIRMNTKKGEAYKIKIQKNPNFKFKSDLTNRNYTNGINDIFEIFISYKNKKEYLVISDKNYNLEIIKLLNLKVIISLKGHLNIITMIRYFINNKNNNEYLISADNQIIIVWDITNNYKIINKIYHQYKINNEDIIASCLLIFTNKQKDYIITSTTRKRPYCEEYNFYANKVYVLNKGNLVKSFDYATANNKIYYLLDWYNKKNDKYYIIRFNNSNLCIVALLNNEYYDELEIRNSSCGFIYNNENNYFLYFCTYDGYIGLYDLYNKILLKYIEFINSKFNFIIQWNNKYAIVSNQNKKSFQIIDLKNNRIISNIYGNNDNTIISVKKIYHPNYGESLLSSYNDGFIKLWIL